MPYALTVTIDLLKDEPNLLRVHATIWIEKITKPIVLGAKGECLKKMATKRAKIWKTFDKKVFLQTWVKVKDSWADDKAALDQLGYQ